jgi:iron complex transport system substrate-binding protein
MTPSASDRTRRRRRLTSLVLALGVVVSACGGGTDDAAPATTMASEEQAAETTTTTAAVEQPPADESATRTVQGFDGPVEVPADPQRIVTLQDQNGLLPLLELGVVPVASKGDVNPDSNEGVFRRVDDFDTSAVTWIGSFREPNLEAIAEQRPDLLVSDPFAGADQLDQLQAIAPVVRIDPFGQPLVDALAQWADLVGRSEQAAAFRAAYDERVAEVVEAIGEPGEISVAVVTAYDGGSLFYYDGRRAGERPGRRRPRPRPSDARDPDGEFSVETFPEHVADFVVVYDYGGIEDPDAEIDAFVESPVFLAHPAVAAGQWARIDGTRTVGSGWSKLGNLIDVLEPLLTDPDLDRSIDGE